MGAVAIGADDRLSRLFFLEQRLMDGPGLDGPFGMAVPASMRLFYSELKLVPERAVRMALVRELLVARSAPEGPVDRQIKGAGVHIGRDEVPVGKFLHRTVLPVTFKALLFFLFPRAVLSKRPRGGNRQKDSERDPYHTHPESHAVLS